MKSGITYNTKIDQWKELLGKSPDSNLFHTPEWKMLIEKTFKYRPLYLFSHDEQGELNGMLPLFFIDKRLTGKRICCVPSGHICGALGDDEARLALYNNAFLLYNTQSAELVEIRGNESRFGFHTYHILSTYVLDVRQSIRIDLHKSIRRYVSKAESTNRTFLTKDRAYIKELYEVNCLNKRRNRVITRPKKFFFNMAEILGDDVFFHIVESKGDVIGGGVSLSFNDDRLLYYIGASHPKHLGKNPSYSYLWHMIETCLKYGYGSMDFGPSSKDPLDSLTQFKLRWGCREEKMLYSFYPDVPHYEAKQSLSHTLIGMMPNFIYKIYSDLLFSSTIN